MCAKRRAAAKSLETTLAELMAPLSNVPRYVARFKPAERIVLFRLREQYQADEDSPPITVLRRRLEELFKRTISYPSFRAFMKDDGSRYPDPDAPRTTNGRKKKER